MYSKTLGDGRKATITRNARGDLAVHINGVLYTTGQFRKLPKPMGPATHAIGVTKVMGLTATEAADLEKVLAAEREAHRMAHLATPEGQRAELADALASASARWTALREDAINTGDGWQRVGPAEKDMLAAETALDAFDAEHPAVIAAILAQQAADTARNIRAALNS